MNPTMLHVNNVCWLGGTMLFTHDVCKVYPEFKHYVLYFNNREDKNVLRDMMNDGISMDCFPSLTNEYVEKIDPCVIWLNNTPGKAIEGEHPWDWLKKWTVISVHHNPTWPLIHAELDIFNSENVYSKYERCIKNIKKWKIVPPCIDTKKYMRIKRDENPSMITIGKLSNDNPKKFPKDLIDIFDEIHEDYPDRVQFIIVGGKKYYGEDQKFRCLMPDFGEMPVEEFYRICDILVYKNCDSLTDTWSRVVTEAMASGVAVVAENKGGPAEQIDHSKNSLLCDSKEGFIVGISFLIDNPDLRMNMSRRAREKANNYDIKRLRDETIDMVLKAAMGVA